MREINASVEVSFLTRNRVLIIPEAFVQNTLNRALKNAILRLDYSKQTKLFFSNRVKPGNAARISVIIQSTMPMTME